MNNKMTTEYMSNEEVIEVLKGLVFGSFDRTTRKERQALDLAIKALEERPQGVWLLCHDEYFSKCSICGVLWLNEECNNYCPNCGAYMRSEDNGKK